jgi:hypothetical protein
MMERAVPKRLICKEFLTWQGKLSVMAAREYPGSHWGVLGLGVFKRKAKSSPWKSAFFLLPFLYNLLYTFLYS